MVSHTVGDIALVLLLLLYNAVGEAVVAEDLLLLLTIGALLQWVQHWISCTCTYKSRYWEVAVDWTDH